MSLAECPPPSRQPEIIIAQRACSFIYSPPGSPQSCNPDRLFVFLPNSPPASPPPISLTHLFSAAAVYQIRRALSSVQSHFLPIPFPAPSTKQKPATQLRHFIFTGLRTFSRNGRSKEIVYDERAARYLAASPLRSHDGGFSCTAAVLTGSQKNSISQI